MEREEEGKNVSLPHWTLILSLLLAQLPNANEVQNCLELFNITSDSQTIKARGKLNEWIKIHHGLSAWSVKNIKRLRLKINKRYQSGHHRRTQMPCQDT